MGKQVNSAMGIFSENALNTPTNDLNSVVNNLQLKKNYFMI